MGGYYYECDLNGSRPVWGAWIEIAASTIITTTFTSRPVWGAWIEIGLCGRYLYYYRWSRPVWGAWIEIPLISRMTRAKQSRPVWGAWIEIYDKEWLIDYAGRRAPYGARGLKWLKKGTNSLRALVAPRMGRVD